VRVDELGVESVNEVSGRYRGNAMQIRYQKVSAWGGWLVVKMK
jgi:hypothetical protein